MKTFYHAADLDGQASAAIVKHRYPETELIGMNYGDPFPWETIQLGEDVWMVDFHLQPFGDMVRLSHLCCLTWIDHHKSAIEEANKFSFIASGDQRLSVDYAACEMTWKECFRSDEEPPFPPLPSQEFYPPLPMSVFYLGRYDIWKHAEHPGALQFQYGMRFQEDTNPDNQTFWEKILHDFDIKEIMELGKIILTYEERQNAKYCSACAFEVELDGLRCIAINRGLTGSLSFKSVYDPAKHDAMLSFVMRKRGQWTVSIYADKAEVDASAICKARGGGGHRGASGFTCETLPF